MKKILESLGLGRPLASSHVGQLFLALLVVHILVGLIRIPRNVSKKLDEISEFQKDGPYAFPFRGRESESAEILTLLATSTSPNSVLYYEGRQKGSMEFAAALLFPRLLIQFDPRYPDRGVAIGRSFDRLRAPDGSLKFPVIKGDGQTLVLRWQ